MTTPINTRLDRYVAAGGETVYNYTFQLFDQNDIQIDMLRADVLTTLTQGADYTVQNVGVFNGGTITLAVAALAGDVYAIYGINEYRASDYSQAGDFLAADVNIDINHQCQGSQQLRRDVDHAIRLPLTEALVNLELPSLADRANTIMGFDNAGNLIVTSTGLTPVLDDATFIVQQPNADLPNAQALSALGTGILKNTTATGVLSNAVQGTDYYAPGGTDVAITDGGTGASSAAAALTNLGAVPLAGGTMTGALILNANPTTDLGAATKQYVDGVGAGTFLTVANNLSDVANAATARGNLGLGTAATQASASFCQVANNLSDVTAATARTNLGLGTAAIQASSAFCQVANNLSDVTAATARTNLGLGTAATQASSVFCQTANNLSDVANTGTALTNLGALPISGGTMTGNLILNADPSVALGAVTKQYADAISAGLTFKNSCYAGTTANLSATYANGTAGVGATLTNSGTLAAFAVDGVSPALNSRILVTNQTSAFQNGIYTLTTVGSAGAAWVLTRSTDFDQNTEIAPGDFIIIDNGTVNSKTAWVQTATVNTIGTDPISFSQFTIGTTGTVSSISAGSANIVCTPNPITGTGTINLAASPSVTNLNLPTSSATAGIINVNSIPYFHSYGTAGSNLFCGYYAGNFTLTSANANTGFGRYALNALTTGAQNTAVGLNGLNLVTSGSYNTGVGNCGYRLTTGTYNSMYGYDSAGMVSGSYNCIYGSTAGTSYSGAESSNIIIGYGVAGTAAESNVLRIGASTGTGAGQLNTAYICGITGIVVTGANVLVSTGNQLGVASSSLRFKNNIQDMGDDSSVFMKLRPVTFAFNDDIPGADGVKQFGLIAEEVAEIAPELVIFEDDGKPLSVKYHDMPAILLNELQKLSKRVAELELREAARNG